MTSNTNAKICPRCGKVVPLSLGVCDHCARLFRTPLSEEFRENQTIMFHHQAFLPTAPVPIRSPRLASWWWLTRCTRLVQNLLSYRLK